MTIKTVDFAQEKKTSSKIVIEQKNDILEKYINAGNKICQFIDNDAKKSLKEIINDASLLIEVIKKYIPVDWRK